MRYKGKFEFNYDAALKYIQEQKRKEFFIDKDSVNLHAANRKRKLNENFFTPSKDEVDAVFNETESMPTTDKTKSYLKIKISSIIGKCYLNF